MKRKESKKKRNICFLIFYGIGISFLMFSPMMLAFLMGGLTDSILMEIIYLLSGTCASVLFAILIRRMVAHFNKHSNKIKNLEKRIKKLESKSKC